MSGWPFRLGTPEARRMDAIQPRLIVAAPTFPTTISMIPPNTDRQAASTPVTLVPVAVEAARPARRPKPSKEDRFPHAPRLDPLRSALAKLDPAAAAKLLAGQGGPEDSVAGPPGASLSAGGISRARLDRSQKDAKQPFYSAGLIKHLSSRRQRSPAYPQKY